ncbi:MAG: hypothetical protein ACYTAN_12405 [Planctomycetota bacterium]|jgi:hypothetical protein
MSGKTDYTVEDTGGTELSASARGVKALVDARLIITRSTGAFTHS